MPSGAPRGNGQPEHGHAEDGHSENGHSGHGHSARPEDGADDQTGSRSECTCGGSTPAACRVCPVCQLIAFVQQVNPDTIDRVADFVGFAATALRDLATAQRERRPGPHDDETDTTRPGDPA